MTHIDKVNNLFVNKISKIYDDNFDDCMIVDDISYRPLFDRLNHRNNLREIYKCVFDERITSEYYIKTYYDKKRLYRNEGSTETPYVLTITQNGWYNIIKDICVMLLERNPHKYKIELLADRIVFQLSHGIIWEHKESLFIVYFASKHHLIPYNMTVPVLKSVLRVQYKKNNRIKSARSTYQ